MADVNSFDPVAWSIDGGRHRAELLRVLAYAASNGAEGVVAPGDCKPRQLTTAGPQIRIDAGAIIFRNRSASVKNQCYVVNNRAETVLDVAPTGASGRSDAIIVRAEDPAYSPWPAPAAGTEADYQYVKPVIIQNVSASADSFDDLGLSYSGYMLGRIDIPANTTNITTSMIVGTRRVAVQRREPFFQRYDHNGTVEYSTTTTVENYGKFPQNIADASIYVPDWATKAVVRVDLTGLALVDGAYHGNWQYQLFGGDPLTTVNTKFTYSNEQQAATSRQHIFVSDMVVIPVAFRDKTIGGHLEWGRLSGVGRWKADGNVQITVDIDFIGAAI